MGGLLERETALAELGAYRQQAASGEGLLVLIGGEAGVGKSSLVRAFADAQSPGVQVLVGACDALATPRPLDPLLDIAHATTGALRDAVDAAAAPAELFGAFLLDLTSSEATTVVVVEDVHWADEATLDLLRFLARRLVGVRALILATYRDDEIGPAHPVRVLLGDVAAFPRVRRLALDPLSAGAVATLAEGTTFDPGNLYRQTGGNAFFVTEVLAAGTLGIPHTARDAVLARAARLSPAARDVLESASVIGARAERTVLEAVAGSDPEALDECVSMGMLTLDNDAIAFRHEIARLAIEESVLPARRASLHRSVLAAIGARPATDPARLAHHAEAAGDSEAALEHSVAAARRAARLGAHREAAAQYARAVRCAASLEPTARAELLEHWSYEASVADEVADALEACEEALALRRELGDRLKEGDDLRWLSRLHWMSYRAAESEATGRHAIEILETLPPSRELARAHANLGQLYSTNVRIEEAISHGERAIALADELGDVEWGLHARISVGLAKLLDDDEHGRDILEGAVERARAAGLDEQAARGLFQLARVEGGVRRPRAAERYVAEGLALCSDRGIEFWRYYLMSWQARVALSLGRWNEAHELATLVLEYASPASALPRRTFASITLGYLRTRRGEPGAVDVLDDVVDLEQRMGTDTGFRGMAAPARVELAWLEGDTELAASVGSAELSDFRARGVRAERWDAGAVAYWLWKCGALDESLADCPAPYALQMSGRWADAAALWDEREMPYEAAWALADSREEEPMRRALALFDGLGAKPAAAIVARDLRSMGVRDLPRAPRRSTAANPAGLTDREVEVARLLAEGLRDAQIANRLVISERTVNHHVSAVLRKLGVATRAAAAAEASRLGLGTLRTQT